MPRSHPPTLIKIVERTLVEECCLDAGARILVAVSGGPDSSGLLHVLSVLAARRRLVLVAHGVDHGLRPEAARELDRAEQLARRCGVPFSRSRVVVEPGGNLQARARAVRYRALRDAAESAGCRFLATGHHADDRAETVLLRLLRGSGPRGLGVLPPRSDTLLRPLVRARRSDVFTHLQRHGIPCCQDPSNRDRRFLRSRVRQELLPLLESMSPGVVGHLNALADQLAGAPGPALVDEGGEVVGLGRAHAAAIRRALGGRKPGARGGAPPEVLLPGGRRVRVDPTSGVLEVLSSITVSARRRAGEEGLPGARRDGVGSAESPGARGGAKIDKRG